jgi:cell wall-associated NlpC family hydrolase
VPLIGRSFSHGVLDCYTLVKDYYKRELNIELQNYFHQNDWWEKGENLYVDNFKDQGFIEINDKNDIQKYDAFLIKLLSSVSNHAAIYIGGDTILHHVYGRLSNRQTYSGYWRKHTTHHLRHKSLC